MPSRPLAGCVGLHLFAHLTSAALEVFVAEKHLLQQIAGYNVHQGIMALARVPADTAIDGLYGIR